MESSLPSPQIHGISVTRFPKTGNTWLKALTFVTVTRSRCSPLRPMNVFLSWNMTLPKIQIIETRQSHWDAKDAFDSLWFFIARQIRCKNAEPLPLEDAFDLFCNGLASYGPYWDHVLGYWRASLESPEKTLFLTYE
ncbi:hypothetical protein NC652_034133 [Populus alba x Populus x berolinensis]|nr:hypothetical protein NC652_034133 [Populus alba x Populus x berolinensis]KAJ6925300.1 hypothetical protein NC651_009839 [Populus alba x Populus x berolinensis]